METYLVGGAVRDTLLGIDPKDRDYVVVGATPVSISGWCCFGCGTPNRQSISGKILASALHPRSTLKNCAG